MRDTEFHNVYEGQALTVGAPTRLRGSWPLGEGWYRLNLRINIAVVIGTGAGAIAESELLFVKNVLLKTSAGEILCNLPGRALYKIAVIKGGTTPRKDAMAAATATYSVDLPIYFTDDKMKRPEDTILDTARYNDLDLSITLGTVADLFTTPGTAAVTATLDAEVERTKGALPDQAKPIFHINYDVTPTVDANSQTFIDLERTSDLGYKRLYTHECSSGSAGVPWAGANADDVKDLEAITDQNGFIVQNRIHEMVQNSNKNDYSLETVLAGVTVFDFVRDGSINSALYSGDKSRLQFKWTNKAGVAANDNVSVAYEAIRSLK